MSKSRRLGEPRCFVIFDPETGVVVAGLRGSPFRLKQQMEAFPGCKVMRVLDLGSIAGARVEGGKLIPGQPREWKPLSPLRPRLIK